MSCSSWANNGIRYDTFLKKRTEKLIELGFIPPPGKKIFDPPYTFAQEIEQHGRDAGLGILVEWDKVLEKFPDLASIFQEKYKGYWK